MRQLSWLNISMVEVAQRRIDVRRDRVGLDTEGVRGATLYPKTVDEAVAKLRSDEQRAKRIRDHRQNREDPDYKEIVEDPPAYKEAASDAPSYALGRLTHRTEPDLKTHTSYLVFAILPRDWSEEDEQRCRQQWPSEKIAKPDDKPTKSKKQMKKEAALERIRIREEKKQQEREAGAEEGAQPEMEVKTELKSEEMTDA
jgi:tRNA (adenine57-N1/adenine58-N1)-methyltransferase